MTLIDLSAPIETSPPELPERAAHRDRVLRSRRRAPPDRGSCSACRARPAARRRGLGGRGRSRRLRHPQLDPRRRALALQLDDPRRARADDRRAAARVVPRPRRRDRRDRPGRRRGARRGRLRGRARTAATLEPLDIVLVRTGRDEFYGELGLHRPRPRRHGGGDALAVRPRRARDGHRRVGLGRAAAHAGRGARARRRARASSGRPTRPTCPTRRSSGCSTWPRCRRRASRSPASR